MKTYKYCPHCGNVQEYESLENCLLCNTKMVTTDIPYDFMEWTTNEEEVKNRIYKKYGVKYKKEYDPHALEKLAQAKEKEEYIPRCPTCQSPDVEKLSTATKIVSTGFFGLGSKTVGKTYKCKNCGYYW